MPFTKTRQGLLSALNGIRDTMLSGTQTEDIRTERHGRQALPYHQIAAINPATARPRPRPLSTFSFRGPAFGVEEADTDASEALAEGPVEEADSPLLVVAALEPPVVIAEDVAPDVAAEPVLLASTGVLCAPGAQLALEGRSAPLLPQIP